MARIIVPGDQATDTSISSSSARIMRIESRNGALSADGHPLRIKGLTWWGAESAARVPAGLTQRSMDEIFSFAVKNNFNAVRLPFSHQQVLFDEPLHLDTFSVELNPTLAPNLKPLRYRQMLLDVCKRAAEHGLLVWLTAHSHDRLWYSRAISEETTMDSWTVLAKQLCPQWNVVAADLKDKPGAASWGMGLDTDWDVAAARVGDHVLSKCKRWLIVVQGVGQTPGADQDAETEFTSAYRNFFDGENLVGASIHPVALRDASKLVYGAHSYGPGTMIMPYMRDDEFPENTEQARLTGSQRGQSSARQTRLARAPRGGRCGPSIFSICARGPARQLSCTWAGHTNHRLATWCRNLPHRDSRPSRSCLCAFLPVMRRTFKIGLCTTALKMA